MSTHALVSDVHHDVATTRAIVINTHIIVSNMCRNMLKREEGDDGQTRTISDTRVIHAAERTLTISQTQNGSAI